jgi:hypothetical protein
MESSNYWLKCTNITSGMLPEEYAIEATTFDGKKISLFVSKNTYLVEPEMNLMRVNVLESGPAACLVYLPGSPLEVSSRYISVPRKDLVER